MSQERSVPCDVGEDVPSVTQQTTGVAPQPPPPVPPFGDGNPPLHTPRRYWRMFNDPGLTPPPLNLGVSTVTPEAF
ncbi:hypothetical protein B296_00027045 [Ensete ventricosum]|uniref:Uncharacterized protein n=1 Tax=Ensete ventricosum TaxID=4639 RepID=A0A426YUM8_ENSVE|nr:hypothetical protein B296_00027045 [Ensete ventricosum]